MATRQGLGPRHYVFGELHGRLERLQSGPRDQPLQPVSALGHDFSQKHGQAKRGRLVCVHRLWSSRNAPTARRAGWGRYRGRETARPLL